MRDNLDKRPAREAGRGVDPPGVERRLIVMRIEPETLEQLDHPGGALIEFGEPIGAYGEDWRAVSHTFSLGLGGEGVLSVLFKRPVRCDPRQKHAPLSSPHKKRTRT